MIRRPPTRLEPTPEDVKKVELAIEASKGRFRLPSPIQY